MFTIKRFGIPVGAACCLLALALQAHGDDKKDKDKDKDKDKAPPPPAKDYLQANQTFGGGTSPFAGKAGFTPLFQQQPGQPQQQPGQANIQNWGVNPYAGPSFSSQTYPNQPPANPYASPYSGYGDFNNAYGGYLQGAASVITAQGQYLIQTQQAYQMYEQLRQSKLQTRRAAVEQWLWERANLPTKEDERERQFKEDLRRAQNDPPLNEIWTGDALNVMLRNAQRISTASAQASARNVPVDEDLFSKINLNSGKAGVNFGLLKNEGKLNWPLAMRELEPQAETRALRNQLQTLTKVAYDKAKEGQVDAGTVRDMEATVANLQKYLLRSVGDMPFAQYTEAKRYLTQLGEGIKALREPNAADFANGRIKLKGNTVGDLLDYMTRNGLQFAPAIPGEEPAYVALHRAMAAYSQSLHAGAGGDK